MFHFGCVHQTAASGNFGVLGVAPFGGAKGHVAVYGDSNCLDSSHMSAGCYEFLLKLVERVVQVRCCARVKATCM